MRPRRRPPQVHPPLALAVLLALLLPPVSHARTPADTVATQSLRRADALARAWRSDEALALLDSLRAGAGARADRNVLMEVQLRRAATLGITGRAEESEAAARAAMTLAIALRDSSVERTALRWLGYSYLARTRLPESAQWYGRLLALAHPAGDALNEGYARTALAYADLVQGRLAASREGYERAVECMRRSGDTRAALTPLIGLARAQAALGEFVAARRSYESVARLADSLDARTQQADAINNLGTIEYQVGDPAQAVRHWRHAVEIYRRLGSGESLQNSAANVAIGEADLGHFDEAARQLDTLLATGAAQGSASARVHVLLQLASVRGAQGRREESLRLLRECITTAGASPAQQADALLQTSVTLHAMGRAAEGLAVLRREALPLRAKLPMDARVTLDLQIARLSRALGQPQPALESFTRAEAAARALGLSHERLAALTGVGRCEWDLGRVPQARAALRQAEALWEHERAVPTDPEWRARRGELAEELCFALARALLPAQPVAADSVALAEGYGVLQRFKARTLLERVAGPGGLRPGADSAVTLRELQRHALRSGELLLDAFVGRDDALMFAVTRTDVRLVRLGSGDSLAAAVRLYRELIATAPERTGDPLRDAVRGRAAGSLSAWLLAPVADLIRGSRRVIVAPDGPLNGISLGELPFEATGAAVGAPLLAQREVVRVPAAAWIAAPPPARAPAPRALLALAGTSDGNGLSLPGAVFEVRALARAYRGVDVRVFGALRPESLQAGELQHYQVLHLAAHNRSDDQRPWNSGVLLGRATKDGEGPWLRAGEIAALHLPARLAVLSGCESGGGRVAWGEGVQGLGTAFLSAGVNAVVVTLWPVDDRVSALFMREFYARLARGETAAGALRGAQLQLASGAATRHPFYWAPYVLIGDGDVRVALKPNLATQWPLLLASVVLLLILVGASRLLPRRRDDS